MSDNNTKPPSPEDAKLADDFGEKVRITDKEETGQGKTPEQRAKSGIDTKKRPKAQRKLRLDQVQPSSSSHNEPESSSESGSNVSLSSSGSETADGKWLEQHPWSGKKPDHNKKMATTISMSNVYIVSSEWRKNDDEVNLQKIYSNLPKFIKEMKGLTSREELERLLYQMNLTEPNTPHAKEIVDKKSGVKPKDKRSLRKPDDMIKAFSLPNNEAKQLEPSQQSYWYLDCEYMLKTWLPEHPSPWFNDDEGNHIRTIRDDKKDKRWIFIPSFRRAQIALLDWPEDDIVTQDSTIRILVVRPSEFDDYVKYCGYKFPVISLPQDEIGAGYPRLWIQKIALRLKLDFIWMIDDSVESFYECHPDDKDVSYKDERRRRFEDVFERTEELVKDAQPPIAAMSPKRFRGGQAGLCPFACSPPRIAVFLNMNALKSKDIFYRPELQALEDMIFGYECEKNGLKVFIDNRVHLQDHPWEDTGARSASVQQKQPAAAAAAAANDDDDDDDDDDDVENL